jgi:hypothetical protein
MRLAMVHIACLLALGCSTEPNYPLRSHVVQPIVPAGLPGAAMLPLDTTFATWNATSSRLAEDIPRAVKRSNWGLLEITDQSLPAAPEAAAAGTAPIRAEALLPDNRVAVIHGWKLRENEVAVGVRIGRFGDAKVERDFIQMLADALAGKPAPRRGGTFTLPPDWPSAD